MSVTLTCRWVPNTLDRVVVRSAFGAAEVGIAQVGRVLGRDALESLYLRGSFVLDAEDERSWAALDAFALAAFAVASAAD